MFTHPVAQGVSYLRSMIQSKDECIVVCTLGKMLDIRMDKYINTCHN